MTAPELENRFIKTYSDRRYRHSTLVRHQGKVIAFAMDADRRIHYAVLELEGPDTDGIDARGWPRSPRELPFPREIARLGVAVAGTTALPVVLRGGEPAADPAAARPDELDPFLSSTARLTAGHPFQVLSDGKHVFLFRQSLAAGDDGMVLVGPGEARVPIVDSTLLVDRYVLVGTELRPTREVRFRRSRNRSRPHNAQDTLGASDMNEVPFFEPTLELDIVRHLRDGRFAVLQLPTETADLQRWQIFAHNAATGRIDSFSIARASDGLFDPAGTETARRPDAAAPEAPTIAPARPRGFAESALRLDPAGAVRIEPVSPFTTRAVAVWVRPETAGILYSETDGPNGADRDLRIGIEEDGAVVVSVVSGGALADEVRTPAGRIGFHEWNAVTVVLTYPGIRVHINGETDEAPDLEWAGGPSTLLLLGGDVTGARDGLGGTVDELRLWDRPLDAYDGGTGLLQRLVGDEPGLALYLRLDEGSGTTAHDQTDHMRNGRLDGPAVWMPSDAPVADTPGIRRTSFTFDGRAVGSGLSAVLYFQQEMAAGGTDPTPRPAKSDARVMLAVATADALAPAGVQHVAVLDLAVARNGRLAEVPDVIALPALGRTRAGLPPLNALLEAVETAEQGVRNLEAEHRDTAARLAAIDAELAARSAERARLAANPPVFAYGAGRHWQTQLDTLAGKIGEIQARRAAPATRLAELDATLAAKRMELKELRARADGDVSLPMPVVHMDPQGLTVAAGLLDVAVTRDRPFLLDSATGTLALYLRGASDAFLVAYADTTVTRAACRLAGGLSLIGRVPDPAYGGTAARIEPGDDADTCTITLSNDSLGLTESWREVPRDPAIAAGVINGGADYEYGRLARGSHPVHDTRAGSLLVKAFAAESGHLEDTAAVGVALDGPVLGTRWVAKPPGSSLRLADGRHLVAAKGADGLATGGDLTLEAWVNPDDVGGPAPIVEQQADGSRYGLWLEPGADTAALAFDRDDAIEVDGIDLAERSFTIEFWARRQAPGAFDLLLYQGTVGTGTLVHAGFRDSDRFTFAFYQDDLNTVAYPDTDWHHWACVFDRDSRLQQVYRDSELVKARVADNVYGNRGPFFLGRGPGAFRYSGALDEVRIWSRARTAEEIKAHWRQRLIGRHPDLIAYWSFADGDARDRSGNGHHGTVHGRPRPTSGWLPHFTVTAGAGTSFARSVRSVPCRSWTHLSAAYDQSYALAFDGQDDYLDCGGGDGLNLGEALTVEAIVRLDDVGRVQGILSKGALGAGDPEQGVPYALYAVPGGGLVFAFEDTNGATRSVGIPSGLSAGTVHRLAVTREKRTQSAANPQMPVEEWLELRLYVDGVQRAVETLPAVTPAANTAPLEIGRASPLGSPAHLRGAVSEVRLWSEALAAGELGRAPASDRRGLVAWWRLEEGEGGLVTDAAGGYEAALEGARWIKDPDPRGSRLILRVNGVAVEAEGVAAPEIARGFHLGREYHGELDEVRLWSTARTEENILDNLFGPLRGERRDLIAYYTFDESRRASDDAVLDHGLRGNHLVPAGPGSLETALSGAPLCEDFATLRNALAGVPTAWQERIDASPAVAEYGDLQYDAAGHLGGAHKRCYGSIRDGDWRLVTGFKVGRIEVDWVGQVQFNPQVMAYVEGAPPVPGENLTEEHGDDFAGATSLEVVEAETVSYAIDSSREGSLDTSLAFSATVGFDFTTDLVIAPLGFGQIVSASDVQIGASTGGSVETSRGWSSAEARGHGRNRTRSTSVTLSGAWTDPEQPDPARPPRRRYQPTNTGFAVVESSTADVFALRLAHTGALIAYRIRPNPDIPRDVNILTFPINPRYTKQGTLDGSIGYGSQGRILDPDYPNAGAPGQHSYLKPREAYALRERIRRQEQRLKAFYDNFAPVMAIAGPAEAGLSVIDDAAGGGAARRLADSLAGSNGRDARAEAYARRNLVNSYIWTAEGGFLAESTETTRVRQDTVGSAYSRTDSASLGLNVGFNAFGADVGLELNAQFGGSLSETRSVSRDAEDSFGIEVTVDLPLGLDRASGDGGRATGTVDAYRFLTFALEPSSENHDALFTQVIDPIWLSQSPEPNAVALRQARDDARRPPCARVLHRVTFVSRVLPALATATMPPVEQALRAADVGSNWLLIRRLDPLVRGRTADFGELSRATAEAVRRHLPELVPHTSEIVEYMATYYGLEV